jgi:hypothetical protein
VILTVTWWLQKSVSKPTVQKFHMERFNFKKLMMWKLRTVLG